ncbi:MAG: transcriptional regulator NrdR [Nannocystaceae bacterium]|nr:transcriptional repressor NrdR [Myxococcales bacterium]
MRCPVCRGATTKVVDSRDSGDGDEIRRRRKCLECGHRFTTRERIATTLPIVRKRDGRRQSFDRNKILAGLKLACRKRNIDDGQLEDVVRKVEQWAATRSASELRSKLIGDRIMHHLHALDQVAFVRFVSVYRSFETVAEFERLLQEMEKAEHVSVEGQRTLFDAPDGGAPVASAQATDDG